MVDPRRDAPWHVQYATTHNGIPGYQVNGPAYFLIYADEVDGLMALLAGIKVDDAIDSLSHPPETLDHQPAPEHSSTGTLHIIDDDTEEGT